MKTNIKILSIILIVAIISSMLPAKTVHAMSRGRLVLIQNEDLTYTAYEDLVVVSPKGNLMVKIASLSKLLGYTYKRIDSKYFEVINEDKSLYFDKASTTYTYVTKDAKTSYNAVYKPYTTKKTTNEEAVNVIAYSTLNKMVHTKYFKKAQSERYQNLDYNGVIVYSSYKKTTKLPDLNKVLTVDGENYFDIHTKYVRENNLYAKRIATGMRHTIGLKADGTVIAAGVSYEGEMKVNKWKNIVAIDTGDRHTIGLKKDGKVVAVGSNDSGQVNTSKWKGIIAIDAGHRYTVGLKENGTVVAVGDNSHGQLNVSSWRDIVAISAGLDHTVGLKADGTVVAVGNRDDGRLNVSKWKDIVAVAAGAHHTIGLKKDGTVVAVGYDIFNGTEVKEWRDIVAISAGDFFTVGLKADGTVITTGNYKVSHWSDVIAISAGSNEILAIKDDGSLYVNGIDGGIGHLKIDHWILK